MANRLLKSITTVIHLRLNLLLPHSAHVTKKCNLLHERIEVRYFSNLNEQPEVSGGNTETSIKQTQEQLDTRLLRIAIIGVPNAGKSSIINQLARRRVCSVSSKVHTTRCKARAISIHKDTQLVFLDTPGLVTTSESQRHSLEHAFHTESEMALLEADVIGVIHDVSNSWTRYRLDAKVLRLLHLYPRKHSFLILNKIDTMKSKRKLLDLVQILTNNSLERNMTAPTNLDTEICYPDNLEEKSQNKTPDKEYMRKRNEKSSEQQSELQIQEKIKSERGWSHFREVFMVSALTGDGTNDVRDYLLHISEPSPWMFPASQFTDQPSEIVVLDTVRSQLLDHLPQEIPYNLTTTMEYFDYGREGSISTVVLVGCPSPRLEKLLVGSRGTRIRAIAQAAEQELQSTFRQPVRLKVVVTSKQKAPSH